MHASSEPEARSPFDRGPASAGFSRALPRWCSAALPLVAAASVLAQSPYGSVEFRWRERSVGVTNSVVVPAQAAPIVGPQLDQTGAPTSTSDARVVLILEARVTRSPGNTDLLGLNGFGFSLLSSDNRDQGRFAASVVGFSTDKRNAASATTAVATTAVPFGPGVALPNGAFALPGTDNNGDRGVFAPFRRLADLGGKNQPPIGVQNFSTSGPLATRATLENVLAFATVDPLTAFDPDTGEPSPYFARYDFYGLSSWVPVFSAVYNVSDVVTVRNIQIQAQLDISQSMPNDSGIRGFRGILNPDQIDAWLLDNAGLPAFTIVVAPGTCCTPLGACSVTLQADCQSGNVWTSGQTCTPNPCPQPFACCFPDGSCTFGFAAACASPGVLGLPNSVCVPNSCPQPFACCFPSGACTFGFAEACLSPGVLGAANSVCTPNECPQPVACCFPDGSCTFGFVEACTGDGVVRSPGSTCAPNVCPRVRTVNAQGPGTVSPWTDAVTDLQSALAVANAGDEIWVALGTYLPATPAGNNQDASFVIPSGVRVYGGFAGTERSPDERSTNPSQNVTTLSGSSFFRRVVTVSGASSDTLLDRLTISGGSGGMQNFGDINSARLGPAMAILSGSQVRLSRVTFSGNTSGRLLPVGQAGMVALPGGAVVIRQSVPVFIDCVFTNNAASAGGPSSCAGGQSDSAGPGGDGGAVAAFDSTATFIACTFTSNLAGSGGDGASCASSAGNGGGGGRGGAIYSVNSSLSLTDCRLSDNRAGAGGLGARATTGGPLISAGGSAGLGGAIAAFGGSVTLLSSTMSDNRAGDGGGPGSNGVSGLPGVAGGDGGAIYSSGAAITVLNSLVARNRAGNGSAATFSALAQPCGLSGGNAGTGGAIAAASGSVTVRSSTIVNNNAGLPGTGSAAAPSFCATSPACCNAGPSGTPGVGGVRSTSSTVTVTGSILWANQNGAFSGTTPSVSQSCVQGGIAGTGNTGLDPLFVSAAAFDYRLNAGSPCIDVGSAAGLPSAIEGDAGGRPRFASGCALASQALTDPPIDMGAFEFQGSGDCNSDGLCDQRQLRGIQLLAAPSPGFDDFFGWSVDATSSFAIVGSRLDDVVGADSGAATVFRRTGEVWQNPTVLTPPVYSAGDEYGNQTAITDQFAFVAARKADIAGRTDAGAVHVFRRAGETWVHAQTLVAPDPEPGAQFGHGIDVDGSLLVVGSLYSSAGSTPFAGAAYVFRLDGMRWVLEQKVTAPDATVNGNFGISVSIQNGRFVAGSPSYLPQAGPNASGAYVFERFGTTWLFSTKLLAPTPQAVQTYGELVVLRDDTLLVNSPRLNHTGRTQAGAVFAYRRSGSGWSPPAQIVSNNPQDAELFGFGMTAEGDRAVIGGFRRAVNGIGGSGAVYVFRRFNNNSWILADRIDNPAPESDSFFGYWPAIVGDRVLIGAHRATNGGVPVAGGVWNFRIGSTLDSNDNGQIDQCEIGAGTLPDADGNGIPDDFQFNPCRADFNGDSFANIDDIFVYIAAWFASDPRADIDGSGLNIDDLFAFISLWFVGCP